MRDHNILRCVIDPLLLWHTGGRCRGQCAVAVRAAVRVSRFTGWGCACVHSFSHGSRGGQSGTGAAVAEVCRTGHLRVCV